MQCISSEEMQRISRWLNECSVVSPVQQLNSQCSGAMQCTSNWLNEDQCNAYSAAQSNAIWVNEGQCNVYCTACFVYYSAMHHTEVMQFG